MTGKANDIEQLLKNLNYPQALAEVTSIRQQATQQLEEWNCAGFVSEHHTIGNLFEQGDLQQALVLAQKLLQKCEQAGAEAYTGADFDLAMSISVLGTVLMENGAVDEALPYFQQAQQHFEALGGERGDHMVFFSLKKRGDCLFAWGQLEQAVAIYEEAIKGAEKRNAIRDIARGKAQLASVRREQKDYLAALQGHYEALELFQQLDGSRSVAAALHNIGMVHREQKQFKQAESTYRQALSINTQYRNRVNEAASLGELGSLYREWNRLEQAMDYYRQAMAIYSKLGNKAGEGGQRNNLAATLIQLNRLDEARPELLRAIECKKGLGHAAEPWLELHNLHNLEKADNNPQAAAQAREQALQAFLDYRRDGGENHSGAGRLALDVLKAIQQGATAEIEQVIEQLLEQDNWQEHKTFLYSLQAILAGKRDPALAEDNEMRYDLVAELKILLEQLQTME